jgi:hypothetical protein
MEKVSPEGLQKYGFFQFIQIGGKISYQRFFVDVPPATFLAPIFRPIIRLKFSQCIDIQVFEKQGAS